MKTVMPCCDVPICEEGLEDEEPLPESAWGDFTERERSKRKNQGICSEGLGIETRWIGERKALRHRASKHSV